MARERGLTPDQRRFVDEYLVDLNGTQAYRRAFPGGTYRTAASEASRLLTNPNIRAELQAARTAQQARTQVRADAALREAARVAFSDVLDLFDPATGRLRKPRDIPLETRRAIASVKVKKGRVARRKPEKESAGESEEVVEYKFWPKPDGLEKVFRHLGLAQPVPPLEVLLAALPAPLAGQVRAALAQALPGGRGPAGGGGDG